MTRKAIALVVLGLTAMSLVTLPAPASHCGIKTQVSIRTGVKIHDSLPEGVGAAGNQVDGRASFAGYGCNLEGGEPLPVEDLGDYPEVIAGVHTEYIVPGATHFSFRAVMNRNCMDCDKPGSGGTTPVSYYETSTTDSGSIGGTNFAISWRYNINTGIFHSTKVFTLASNVRRIRVTVTLTDVDEDADVWKTVNRTYGTCWTQPEGIGKVCVPPEV